MYLDIKRKTTSSKSQRDQRFSPSKLTVFWIDEWTRNSEPRTPTHQCTVDSCSGWTFNSLNSLKKFKLTFYYQRSSPVCDEIKGNKYSMNRASHEQLYKHEHFVEQGVLILPCLCILCIFIAREGLHVYDTQNEMAHAVSFPSFLCW